jgi:hypothetical protein
MTFVIVLLIQVLNSLIKFKIEIISTDEESKVLKNSAHCAILSQEISCDIQITSFLVAQKHAMPHMYNLDFHDRSTFN